jgi:CspA family cold shock protein
MKTGIVKFFNETKGFGFIVDNETKEEYFCHVSGINEKITENNEVRFELVDGKKGKNAINVSII